MRSSLWPRECKGTVQADQIRFYPRKYKDNVQTRASVAMILNPCTVQTDPIRLYDLDAKSRFRLIVSVSMHSFENQSRQMT